MHRVTVQNLYKEFRIYERPKDRLTEIILRRPMHKVYHVLNDISFSVLNGKSLGIVGDNGAGKSTLLKLLVGTLQPTAGQISIAGQVAALLELGAGFHPEFTGRRNIYLNASLLGVPDDNIPELENDIIEFSELDYFIDRPVKTYSSGMYVRLAFSIATMVRPDVLVIDEALSVGDLAFQKKCVDRMNRFRQEQKTMVFCSHSMYHVQQLCDNAIWIDKGSIRAYGTSDEVVGIYEDHCNSKKVYHSITEDIPVEAQAAEEGVKQRDCRILSVHVRDPEGQEITVIPPLSDLVCQMEVEVLGDNVEGNFGFAFMKSTEEVIASFLTTDIQGVHKGPFMRGEKITVTIRIESIAMRVGQFYVLGGVADRSGLLWYETRPSKPLQMEANRGVGSFAMKSSWQVEQG
ncbi:MAG: hypothetical protein RLZZ385_706 [Pseudomonadota bacterium]|jgi:ABC-type polysaccharide/polyol phosphate transport system ATPase subunit